MRKQNKILVIFMIISAIALGFEVKMNHYFIRQAKIESIRNEYKIKHLKCMYNRNKLQLYR